MIFPLSIGMVLGIAILRSGKRKKDPRGKAPGVFFV